MGANLTVNATSCGDYVNFYAEPAQGVRSIQLLEITKGSPNYSIRLLVNQTLGAGSDVSLDTFLQLMEATNPALASYTWGSNTPTLAVDESTGAFDAINFYWQLSNPVFEISDITVARLA